MTDTWDGRPQNPERDGWHWLRYFGEKDEPIEWVASNQAWFSEGCWWYPPFDVAHYLGPCLTPAEVEARVGEAATACSAAWNAAPAGEGVMGAEYFAELAALKVLQTGKSAVEVCNEMFAGVGNYGVSFMHVLLTREEFETRIAAARREGIEAALPLLAASDEVLSGLARGECEQFMYAKFAPVVGAFRALLPEGGR